MGALLAVEASAVAPLLKGIAVAQGGVVVGRLIVRQGVRAAQEVLADPDFAEGIERKRVLVDDQAFEEPMRHAETVGVDHELLVADGQSALQPSGGMQDEVCARQQGGVQGVDAFLGRLSVRYLRRRDRPAAAERHAQPPGQLTDREIAQRGFGHAEGGGA